MLILLRYSLYLIKVMGFLSLKDTVWIVIRSLDFKVSLEVEVFNFFGF